MKLFSPNVPFRPSSAILPYGFVILLLSGLGVGMSFAGQTLGLMPFFNEFADSFAISSTALATLYMFGTIASGLLQQRSGRLLDRFGPRRFGFAAIVSLAILLVLFSLSLPLIEHARERFSQTLSFTLSCSILFAFFFCVRFLAQGCAVAAAKNMAAKWFNQRGLFNIPVTIISAIVWSVSIPLSQGIIEAHSWVLAIQLIAAAQLCYAVICWAFYRDTPEECDMEVVAFGGKKVAHLTGKDQTVEFALSTRIFWCVSLTLALAAFVNTGVSYHAKTMFVSAGRSVDEAVQVFAWMWLPTFVVLLALGVKSDHLRIKNLLIGLLISISLTAIGTLLLKYPGSELLLSIGFGSTNAVFSLIATIAWPKLFGLKHLGEIYGCTTRAFVVASGVAPLVFSLIQTYTQGFFLSGVICLLLSCLLTVATLLDTSEKAIIEMNE